MKPTTQQLYKTIQSFYQSCVTQAEAIDVANENEIDPRELADYAYGLRECAESLEALEKNLHKLQGKIEKKLAFIAISQNPGEPIKTDYCTAHIEAKLAVEIPKLSNRPDDYFAMCKEIGISEELATAEIVRVHYPGLEKWMTQRAEQGLPVPQWAASSKEYDSLKVKLVKRRDANLTDPINSKETAAVKNNT